MLFRSAAILRVMPDLVLSDISMPAMSGFELLERLTALAPRFSNMPFVFLTALTDRDNELKGRQLGADDYVTKPFNPRELLARIRAVLRRKDMARAASLRDPERGGFRFDGWLLERRTRRLTDRQGNPVPLTKGEYALLIAFLDAPQRPLTREYLLQATRMHEDIFDRSIDVQVLRLRRKLESIPTAPRLIHTERGIGYVFAKPVERF